LSGTAVGETTTSGAGVYNLSALPEGPIRLSFASPGFKTVMVNGLDFSSGQRLQHDVKLDVGAVSETVTVRAESVPLNAERSSISTSGRSLGSGAGLGGGQYSKTVPRPVAAPRQFTPPELDAARASIQSAALAQELGDLFEYKLKEPITIERNRSALVPIVQSPVTAEKVSVWNDRSGSARPQRALWLTNSTAMTLDGGSFSVLEEETFAGEGLFDAIRPGAKRLVSYATDLALNASSKNTTERQRVSRVRIAKGILTQESEVREKKAYTFRNEDTTPRTVIIEHPVRAGYELRGDVKPAETTAAWMRFRLPVAPKETATLVVEEARPLQSTVAISDVTSDRVALFISEKSISPAIESSLRRILAQKNAVSELESQKSEREDEAEKIFDDQQRLRENLKALKGSADEKALIQRYTKQLDEQENRLEAIRKESARLQAQIDAAQAAVDKSIQELSFDERL
jgi:hypothetical protein